MTAQIDALPVEMAAEEKTAAESIAPLKILVVDDNPDWGNMLVGVLKDEGYLARAEGNEPGALRALREEVFHLALVDVRLRGEDDEDGLTLAREIKRLYPYTGVVLWTGYASVERLASAARHHALLSRTCVTRH